MFSAKPKKRRADDSSDSEASGPTVTPRRNSISKNVTFSEDIDDDDQELEVLGDVVDPANMLQYAKDFAEFLERSEIIDGAVKTLAKHADDFIQYRELAVDSATFVKSFRKYLGYSVRPSNMSLKNAIGCMTDYLGRGDIVMLFPDFPRRPPMLQYYYAKKKGLTMGIGKMQDVKSAMSEDHLGRQEAEHELGEMEEKFLRDMEAFQLAHAEDLQPKQTAFLDAKIKTLKRKILGPQPRTSTGKTPSKKKGKIVTAFSLFCETKMKEDYKYKDMDPEKRERKLMKKFEKLPDSEREIYEKVALL